MTASPDDVTIPSREPSGQAARASRRRGASAVAEVCPLLRSRDGSWSSAYAARDHRCWAVRPPAQPAIAKQREVCLVAAHAGCATYLAAMGVDGPLSDARSVEDGHELAAGLWPPTRAVPVVLEPVRGRPGIPVTPTRTGGQALLVGVMVLAFLVLVIARTTSPSASDASPSATVGASQPGAVATASASPVSSVSPAPDASASAVPTPAASVAPTASPAASSAPSASPSGPRTYTVKAGDTLGTIAEKYGTTVKAIAAANNITNTRIIHPGQVLVIP